jgi:hypothetical protein
MYCSTCGAYVFRSDGYCYNCQSDNSEDTTYVKPEWGEPRPVQRMGTQPAQPPPQFMQQHPPAQPPRRSHLPYAILGAITGLSIVAALIAGGLYISTLFKEPVVSVNVANPFPAPSSTPTPATATTPAPAQTVTPNLNYNSRYSTNANAPINHGTNAPEVSSRYGGGGNDSQSPQVSPSRLVPIINSNFLVPARRLTYFPINVPSQGAQVTGRFSARGGMGNDIEAFIIPAFELPNVMNGNQFRYFYTSGKVTVGEINVRLQPGSYYLVFNNKMSLISNKGVAASVFMSLP